MFVIDQLDNEYEILAYSDNNCYINDTLKFAKFSNCFGSNF